MLNGNTTTSIQYLSQTGNGSVSSAPVWNSISGSDVTGSALSKVDDTNVTLSLGGSASTSLLRAASITAGWNGQLGLSRGGTNANLTATLGGLLYSNATQLQMLNGNITTGIQYLSQTGNGSVSSAPVWNSISGTDVTGSALSKVDDTNVTLSLGGSASTSLLRAASITAGWTGQLGLSRGGTNANLTAVNGGVVYSGSTGLGITAAGTSGQILQSTGAGAPTWTTASSLSPLQANASVHLFNTGFQVSTTRNCFVFYSVEIAAVLSLAAGQTCTIYLEIASDSGFTTNLQELGRCTCGTSGSLTIGLNITNTNGGCVSGFVPMGYYIRLRTSGTATYTYRSGQEILL
jgi:hypothetical protein